jgi:hypothetical protein
VTTRPRDNPFAARRLAALAYRAVDGDPEALLDRFEALGRRGALVAPEGHGKSSLLAELARRLPARGLAPRRLVVARDRPLARGALAGFLAAAGPADVLLVDGAGHLGARDRLRLRRAARRAGGLLVTAHRPGPLPTLAACTTSPALLDDLVRHLLAGRRPPVPLPAAAALYARHAGNLRTALLELYDRCAGLPPEPLRPSGW